MTDQTNAVVSEEEKRRILMHEYDTLRAEILTRTNNLFQLVAVVAVFLGWLIGHAVDLRFWLLLAISSCVTFFFYKAISRGIAKAAARLREIEREINNRVGETLLVWETRWGGAVIGHWLQTKRKDPPST